MGRYGKAAVARDLARSRTTSNDLAFYSQELGVKILGLSVCVVILVGITLLGMAMLGGYVSPSTMSPVEIRQVGTLAMCLGGMAAAFTFYLLLTHWMMRARIGLTRVRLDKAIEAVDGH